MSYTTIDVGGGTKLTFDSNDPPDATGIVIALVIVAVIVGLFVLIM